MTPEQMLHTLVQREEEGKETPFLLFWGHTGSGVGPWVFSQWWEATFVVRGVTFTNAEEYMMYSKAEIFGDEEAMAAVLASGSPKEAKTIGRRVKNYDDAVWARERYSRVVEGNLAKFGQSPDLWEYLVSTRGKVLVEASPYDRIWGIGLRKDDPRALRARTWQGANLLGFALVDVRQRLTV